MKPLRVGLLSDSHGREAATRRAARVLREEGADLVLHLGDIGSAAVLEALVGGLEPRGPAGGLVHVVFGNIDLNPRGLRTRCRYLGITVHEPLGRLRLAGKTVVFLHGHLPALLREELAEGPDYLCHGHSHRLRDDRIGPTRVINPGALFRAGRYTVALLEVPQDGLRFIEIPPR